MKIDFAIIETSRILEILPLLTLLNSKTPSTLLEKRVLEMANLAHYECAAVYVDKNIIGICGLWFTTRHYIGKTVEVDHVVIDPKFRDKKIGEKFFEWIHKYVQYKGCESIELNAYTKNTKAHKFYDNKGYDIYGFHFLKVLRKDAEFY